METQNLDLASVRREFPVLNQSVAGRPLAYLDNAATTQRPLAVLQAVDDFSRHDNANVHRGVHLLSQRATNAYEAARAEVARWINAPQTESVVFTKGCTEAINLVATSWGRTAFKPGDVILVSTMEHHSNLVPWQMVAEEVGAMLKAVPLTNTNEIDLDWLESNLDNKVKIVCVKAVCNATGVTNPIKQICRLAHERGAVAMIDAAQALAHQKIDVQEWDADFVACTAHKAYGPMGIGALYARYETLAKMPPYQTGGGMVRGVTFERTNFADPPERFEAGTPNVSGAVGFAEAARFLCEIGVARAASHETTLASAARRRLQAIEGVTVFGGGSNPAPVVSFTIDVAHSHDVGTVLDQFGVAVRTGHHCCMPLMKHLGVPATTRASFALYNTMEEVDALIGAVHEVKKIFS